MTSAHSPGVRGTSARARPSRREITGGSPHPHSREPAVRRCSGRRRTTTGQHETGGTTGPGSRRVGVTPSGHTPQHARHEPPRHGPIPSGHVPRSAANMRARGGTPPVPHPRTHPAHPVTDTGQDPRSTTQGARRMKDRPLWTTHKGPSATHHAAPIRRDAPSEAHQASAPTSTHQARRTKRDAPSTSDETERTKQYRPNRTDQQDRPNRTDRAAPRMGTGLWLPRSPGTRHRECRAGEPALSEPHPPSPGVDRPAPHHTHHTTPHTPHEADPSARPPCLTTPPRRPRRRRSDSNVRLRPRTRTPTSPGIRSSRLRHEGPSREMKNAPDAAPMRTVLIPDEGPGSCTRVPRPSTPFASSHGHIDDLRNPNRSPLATKTPLPRVTTIPQHRAQGAPGTSNAARGPLPLPYRSHARGQYARMDGGAGNPTAHRK